MATKLSKNAKAVVKGYLNLTDSDRKAVLDEIKRLGGLRTWERRIDEDLIKGSETIYAGPLSGDGCPCCGK